MEYEIVQFKLADSVETKRFMIDIIEQDFGYPFHPIWHSDIANLDTIYYKDMKNIMFLAKIGDEIVGTAGVRIGSILSKKVPYNIKERYSRNTTCRLVRVFVKREYRKNGIAKALVEKCLSWITNETSYQKIILDSEFAISFWEKLGAKQIYDERPYGGYCVHFELELDLSR